MGTRIHAYLSHDMSRFDDIETTFAKLKPTLSAALAVQDYWPEPTTRNDLSEWEFEHIYDRTPDVAWYSGPGPLFIKVNPKALLIYTGGRWRGFLKIDPLREVHLAAFFSIAKAFDNQQIALCHDSCEPVWELFMEGGSQKECIDMLRQTLGPPQPSVNSISESIFEEAKRRVPDVWFLESVSRNA